MDDVITVNGTRYRKCAAETVSVFGEGVHKVKMHILPDNKLRVCVQRLDTSMDTTLEPHYAEQLRDWLNEVLP